MTTEWPIVEEPLYIFVWTCTFMKISRYLYVYVKCTGITCDGLGGLWKPYSCILYHFSKHTGFRIGWKWRSEWSSNGVPNSAPNGVPNGIPNCVSNGVTNGVPNGVFNVVSNGDLNSVLEPLASWLCIEMCPEWRLKRRCERVSNGV